MKHILMVDDVKTNLKCAEEVLKDSYEITMATSGKEALRLLGDIVPDLVLLDINMPEMDGYEVLEKMRQEKSFQDIPVVFLTARTDRESEEKGRKLGALDYIHKPYEPEVLLERLDKVLHAAEKKQESANAARRDLLTGLLNRKYMEALVDQKNADAETGYLMLLNLDNFQLVNETYGYGVGDDVLVHMAEVLKEEVGEQGYVCRIGGDEFAVFVPCKQEAASARSMARRMVAGIEFEVNEILSRSGGFKISVSIGIASKPEDGTTFEQLYENADKALYFVKQNGKRGYYFYSNPNLGSNREPEEEDSLIDLIQLQRLIQEKGNTVGAYQVGYDGLQRIYHFVARSMERKSQDVQLVLFTAKNVPVGDEENSEKVYATLEQAVSKSLRRGDVAARCGNLQYVVILMNASRENGALVAGRIRKKFNELLQMDSVSLDYEMQSIEKQ